MDILRCNSKCQYICRSLYDESICSSVDSLKEAFKRRKGKCSQEDLDQALLCCAYKGNLDGVNLLLDKGADVTVTDNNRDNALTLAAAKGYSDVVEILLHAGCPLDNANAYSHTPLLKACLHEHPDVVKIILEYLSHETSEKAYLRRWALRKVPKYDNQFLNYDVSSYAGTPLIEAVRAENKQIVEMLLEGKVQIDEQHYVLGNITALHIAAKKKSVEMIKLLLASGADINVVKNKNITPLMDSIMDKNEEITLLLLKHGADVNISHFFFRSKTCILSEAVRNSASERIMVALCEAVADLNFKDKYHHWPLSHAIGRANFPAMKCFIRYGCTIDPPRKKSKRVGKRQKRLDKDLGKRSLLHTAIQSKNIEAIKLLYSAGAFTNKKLLECYDDENLKDIYSNQPDVLELIQKFATNPTSLVLWCRNTINCILRRPLPSTVPQLGLPPLVRDFLLYSDL